MRHCAGALLATHSLPATTYTCSSLLWLTTRVAASRTFLAARHYATAGGVVVVVAVVLLFALIRQMTKFIFVMVV